VSGIAIEVGLSVGIAFIPDHAASADEAMRHADIAMYAAKRRKISHEFYTREDDQNSVRRLSMVSDLRSAIANSELDLLYQPQIELRSGELVGAEALLRWQHPVHGQVSPEEFIAIAESTDLIQPLTDWLINEALRQVVCWQQEGIKLRVAVNLSARSLQHVGFPKHVELMLGRFGLEPRWLELEITETAMMLDPARALAIVRDLQALGVRVAIDDFGTGYSSLGYLRDLRVDALKLDKSFVIDLENRQQNRVIVESTAQMGAALGLEVVAEGVESQWVSDYLARAGYRIGQGYWFGKPAPPDELANRFRQPVTRARTA
jgi:EAL domain-containing protein (putative c-di-GMP-specific phosphodiesterase class I)